MTVTAPAAAAGAPAGTPAGTATLGSLSPSRASDFLTCPLLFRFRTIDRLPEQPGSAAVRGTVVHAVLERLFDLVPGARTPEAALALVRPEWERLLEAEPELGTLFADDADGTALETWLESAKALVEGWFGLEDPTRLAPAARELRVECELPSGLSLRGYVDRLDEAPDGALRIVDYKTGRAPSPDFEARAMFQMRFYALVIWRSRGVLPRLLQLVYLADRVVLRYAPDEADLLATERKIDALWTAIRTCSATGDWRPRRGPLCAYCDHQALCPEFGGTPPPLPDAAAVDLGRVTPVDELA